VLRAKVLFSLFLLSGCVVNMPPIDQATLPDRKQGFESSMRVTQVLIHPTLKNRTTPITVQLLVPNSCIKLLGGNLYGRGNGILADFYIRYQQMGTEVCSDIPTILIKTFHYGFPIKPGKAVAITIQANGVHLMKTEVYGAEGYQPKF